MKIAVAMARDLSNTVNVPTFYPTMEQLENWEEFVDTMEEAGAHKIGIAKLVMPEGWQARQAGYSLGNIGLKVGKVLNQHIIPTKVDGAFSHTAISESVNTENMTVAKFLAMTLHTDHQPPVGNFLELEEKYWARHRRPDLKPPVYGADIHSTLMDGSLKVFNLNKMNERPEAILRHDEGDRFGGVHDSYIFLGMWASTFSWHVEDQVAFCNLLLCYLFVCYCVNALPPGLVWPELSPSWSTQSLVLCASIRCPQVSLNLFFVFAICTGFEFHL